MAALAGPFLVTTALLGAGGAMKLVRPATTARALKQMGFPATPTAVRIGATVELAVAVAAALDASRPFAALVALSYLGFAAFVLAALRRDVPLSSCGCFGGGRQDTPPTAVHLAINVAAAATAGAVALGLADGGGLEVLTTMDGSLLLRGAFVLSTLTATWLAYTALTELPRLTKARATTAR